MNLRDLNYLVALAEHQHFGKAAAACFVSQPGLSIQIQKLEEELGVQLIERTNKSLLFTEVGLNIVDRARQILNQVEELREQAKLAKNPFSGKLTIGIFPSLAPYLLPMIIPGLAKKYSKVSFYLVEEKTATLIEKLKDGKLNAAFLALPVQEKNLTTQPLFEEEFLLAIPSHHALAQNNSVNATDINNQEMYLLEEGHCLREQALSFCLKANANESQNFRATSIETLRLMVASGNGMTLMPKLACDQNKNIAYIPFEEPKPSRTIGLCWRDSTSKSPLLEDMVLSIKEMLCTD